MNKYLTFVSVCVALFVGLTASTRTGIAMSAHSTVLQNSKPMIIDYVQAVFKEISFDDIEVPVVNWKVQNMKFHTV